MSTTTSSTHSSSKFLSTIDTYFSISTRNSTIPTEIRSGITSFLTLSYLLLVNPKLMSQSGVPNSDAVFATALSSGLSSLCIGLFANLPFGAAPGIGLSAYLVYGLVLADLLTLKESLMCCAVSGLLLGICVLMGLMNWIMRVVPRSIKVATVVGMGILLAMIGLVTVNIITANAKTLVQLGDMTTLNHIICFLGIILIGTFLHFDIKGGILIGITILTIVFWCLEHSFPNQIVQTPKLEISWNEYWYPDILWDREKRGVVYPAIGAFLIIAMFDISGVMFGLATLSDLIQEDGTIPNSLYVFLSTALGTIIAAFTGSTPIIVPVECVSGIKEGGRTGLTSVTIGLFFLLSIFFAPLLGAVPEEATAPVLVLVGAMMMGESGKINWEEISDAVPAFLTICMMPFTYSITNGMVFGLVAALAFYVTTGGFVRDVKNLWKGTCHAPISPIDEENLDGKPLVRTGSFLLSEENTNVLEDEEGKLLDDENLHIGMNIPDVYVVLKRNRF